MDFLLILFVLLVAVIVFSLLIFVSILFALVHQDEGRLNDFQHANKE